MRKIILLMILAAMMLTVPCGLFAQAGTLTLEKARELALSNSPSLAKINLSVQSSLLNQKSQTYSNLPSFSLGASASASLWTKDGVPQDLAKDSFSAGANLGISQKLWNGGRNAILKAINSLSTEMSRQDALAEYYSVLDSADSDYYGVLEAAAALDAAESSLATANLALSMAEIRRQTGVISDALYLQALSDQASKETTRNQRRRDLSLANLKLRVLLGLGDTPALEPVNFASREDLIQLLSNFGDPQVNALYTSLWKQLQSRNPSMLKATMAAQKAEKNITLTGRDYSPTLGASLGAGLFNYTINNGFQPGGGQLSLSLSIPLDFWDTANNVNKQKIARDQSALDLRSAVSTLDINLRTALLDLISQAGQILSSRKALDYAQKNFDYVLELYRLSKNSPQDLSDAETMLRTARNQLISSQYSFLMGLSSIRSIGVFDSEDEVIALIQAAAKP